MREQVNFFDKLGMRSEGDEPISDSSHYEHESPEPVDNVTIPFPRYDETKAARLAREAQEKEEKIRRYQESRVDIFG